jgi:leucyl aminopeptidase
MFFRLAVISLAFTSILGFYCALPTVTELSFTRNADKLLQIRVNKETAFQGDLLVVPMFQPGSQFKEINDVVKELKKTIPKFDSAITSIIEGFLEEGNFKGEASKSEMFRIFSKENQQIKYLSLVGMGEYDKTKTSFTSLGKTIANIAEKSNANSVGVLVPSQMMDEKSLHQMLVGLHDASYKDFRFKKETEKLLEDKKKGIKEVQFLGITDDSLSASLESITKKASSIASGVNFAKDLVGAPANAKTPLSIAEEAKRIATNSPNMKIDVLGLEECEKLEMGGYLGVQKGSKFPPQFIHLQYSSPKKNENCVKIALIGKGLTFDR